MSSGHYSTRANFRVRKCYASKGDDVTLSRWTKDYIPAAEQLSMLRLHRQTSPRMENRPAIKAGRSLFHNKGISQPKPSTNFFVSAISNAKIGRDVRKGLFKGYWIYTLSLEERATCPRSCVHWTDCYGNNMPYATRIDVTDYEKFIAEAGRQLDLLCNRPKPKRGRGPLRTGVLVRLHALGDFFSPEYVEFWLDALRKYPKLAVYGYTARRGGSIAMAINAGKSEFGRRFAIRFSDGDDEKDCTVSIQDIEEIPADAFQCPEQYPGFTSQKKPILCATCGLCWSTDKNVAFLEH